MNKILILTTVIMLAFNTPVHAGSADKKRDAELKANRVDTICKLTNMQLSYAMSYADRHGISKIDAVAKIQTIASDQNKPIVRFMAIEAFDNIGDASKADAENYCAKQLAKRPYDELSLGGLLDGGDARTLFGQR